LLSGRRYTFVNISEATHRVVGVKDRQGTDGAYEAAFMSALEESVLNEPLRRESPEMLRDLVRRGVRVLSLDEWMAEASKEDREAYIDFL
jgi:CxxC motif-containing protein